MSSIPSQIRTIDSFAEYNSNVANRLTRMLSGNDNVLMSANSLQLTVDSTAPLTTAVVQTGMVFKDDVFIEINADHQVDFTDLNNYITPGAGFDEIGYYYIVLEYTYVKSRPAPVVNIKILKPSQRSGYPIDSLMLLGVVNVINVGITQGIDLSDPFYNYDPDDEDNRREYVKTYVGSETGLPTHDTFQDQSRIAYDTETDSFWLGYRNFWQEFGVSGSVMTIDTTGTTVGELCYVDSTGKATAAIATGLNTGADIAVVSVGLAVDSSGKGLTSGFQPGVPIQTAIIISTGDLLYLSSSEAGTVTNVKTFDFYQVVGRALSSGTGGVGSGTVDIIFTPKVLLSTSLVGQLSAGIGPAGAWIFDPGSGNYYSDIDISELDVFADFAVLTSFFDSATDLQVFPEDVEMLNSGDTLRIWMTVSTIDLNYIISVGGGGSIGIGGGGGGADHSALLNLSYGASGHSGFAPTPHGNGDHSSTFITTAGVTYGALLANADIGTGATQVSQGNHTHDGLIASGTIMLFGTTAAPTGWTKKTTDFTNNAMVVLTTGSSYDGGSQDARSFNPGVSAVAAGNHSHTISTQASHSHSFGGTTGVNSGPSKDQGSGDTDAAPENHTHNFAGTTGSSGSHSHGGATGANGNHNHTINYSNYAPYYFRLILATKN